MKHFAVCIAYRLLWLDYQQTGLLNRCGNIQMTLIARINAQHTDTHTHAYTRTERDWEIEGERDKRWCSAIPKWWIWERARNASIHGCSWARVSVLCARCTIDTVSVWRCVWVCVFAWEFYSSMSSLEAPSKINEMRPTETVNENEHTRVDGS